MKRNTPAVSFTTVKKIVVSMVFALNHGVAWAEDAKSDDNAKLVKKLAEKLESESSYKERSDKEICRQRAEKIEELESKATAACENATFRTDTDSKSKKSKSSKSTAESPDCAQRIVNCMGAETRYVEPEKPEASPVNSVLSQFPQYAGMANFLTSDPGIDNSNDKRCPTMTYDSYVNDQKRMKDELADLEKKIKDANKDLDEVKKDFNDKNKEAAKTNKEAQKDMSTRKTENAKELQDSTKDTQKMQTDTANQIAEKRNDIIKAQGELLQRQQQCQKAMSSYDDSLLKTKCYAEMVKAKKALEESGTYTTNAFNAGLANTLKAAYKQCRQDGRRDFLDKEANCNSELRGGAKSISGIEEQIAGLQASIEQATASLQATSDRLKNSDKEAEQVYQQTLQEQISFLKTAQTELTNKQTEVQKEIADIEKQKSDIKFKLQTMGQSPRSNAKGDWTEAKTSLNNFAKTAYTFSQDNCCTNDELRSASGSICSRAAELKQTVKDLNSGRELIPEAEKKDKSAAAVSGKPVATPTAPAANKASTNGDGTK